MLYCLECKKDGRKKNASFGLEKDGKKTHCAKHKTENMINLTLVTICITCKEEFGKPIKATFGFERDGIKTHLQVKLWIDLQCRN